MESNNKKYMSGQWGQVNDGHMTNKGGIVGRDNFKAQIEKLTGREIVFRLPGRPKKVEK